jgi:16S rRNA processing protein RimM
LPERRILMGAIGRPHGVRGLVRVHSYTADPHDLPRYAPLSDERGRFFGLRWEGDGIAALHEIVDGQAVPISDRRGAERLVNVRLYADRAMLPQPGEDEFYLADLIGLEATRPDGTVLGRVEAVHDYGAGASLEVGALLVPFTRNCVPEVAIEHGRLTVVPPDEVFAEPTRTEPAALASDAAR